jgi:hypothetical protein
MSGNKNSEEATGLAILFVLGAFFAIGVWIFLAVVTAIMSLIALVACFHPLRIGGEVISRKDGYFFLLRGVIGWFAFPFIVLSIAPMFDIGIERDWIVYIMMTGYMIGSTGMEYVLYKMSEGAQQEAAAPVQTYSPPPSRSLPSPPGQPEPFRYASWDDEEEGRR